MFSRPPLVAQRRSIAVCCVPRVQYLEVVDGKVVFSA
jgi:hypothetical protein